MVSLPPASAEPAEEPVEAASRHRRLHGKLRPTLLTVLVAVVAVDALSRLVSDGRTKDHSAAQSTTTAGQSGASGRTPASEPDAENPPTRGAGEATPLANYVTDDGVNVRGTVKVDAVSGKLLYHLTFANTTNENLTSLSVSAPLGFAMIFDERTNTSGASGDAGIACAKVGSDPDTGQPYLQFSKRNGGVVARGSLLSIDLVVAPDVPQSHLVPPAPNRFGYAQSAEISHSARGLACL